MSPMFLLAGLTIMSQGLHRWAPQLVSCATSVNDLVSDFLLSVMGWNFVPSRTSRLYVISFLGNKSVSYVISLYPVEYTGSIHGSRPVSRAGSQMMSG
ncbi:hypothetical protein BO78DRAFT_19189 [Aspergillus sclerotiicarbonarius CBS 121057]|uniref:Secreted protein n=1 Tax=Aspergillus sclerotiicarbonarius (strain CBS 121057 / IBT 28362) TaxID=1448318 RepID=A0A319EK82_ASPSB|nr:hypothetical protein BO78DRAFT_19189 [Aspergillus sclerotiicarbonarius CBS 121057]